MESSKQSQNAIGRELGLSSAQMTKLKKQGMPVHLGLEACRQWRHERLNIAQRKPDPAPVAGLVMLPPGAAASDESHDQARTRREIAEANLAELRLRELRGDLVRVEKIKAQHQRRVAAMREAFLQLPARVVPLLLADSSATALEVTLKREINAALRQVTEVA
jgi:hypothetical protein